jgi:class 3 adenylate cyclase
MIYRLFPPAIAQDLRRGESIPLMFVPHTVGILWADLVGFTALSSDLDSFDSMQLLDNLYSRFDELLEYSSLWKMDTIGDAYVVVGNLMEDGEQTTALALSQLFRVAQGMVRTINEFRSETGSKVGIRIGIDAGPAICGIVGTLRPRFHVFGEAVLGAEKMESTATRDGIHVSQNAAQIYRSNQFQFGGSEDHLVLSSHSLKDERSAQTE